MSSLPTGALRLVSDIRDVFERRRLIVSPEFASPRKAQYEVLVYFADRPKNFYQLQQWLAPLEELGKKHSTAIICTRADMAGLVRKRTMLPIVMLDGSGRDARLATVTKPKVMLYLNHNNLNFRPLRFIHPIHAFISHGESDKIFMSSNLLKGFDYDFVAGQAAKDRLAGNIFNYDVDSRAIPVGRPQLDSPPPAPEFSSDGRTVVLYAPTWEGYRPTMRYSSVVSHGEPIVEGLIADARYRVIYRPHPLTGTVLPAFKGADDRIRDCLVAANSRDPQANHFVDDTAFGWQLQTADVMITDVSAVAYDWLTTAKPQILTRPVDQAASTDNTVLLDRLPKLGIRDVSRVVDVLDSVIDDSGQLDQMVKLAMYYYGDTASGASTNRFIGAVDRLIEAYSQSAVGRVSEPTAKTAESDLSEATTRIADKLVEHTLGRRVVSRQQQELDAASAELVVNFHASDKWALEDMTRWLPTLERLHRDRGVVVMAGNMRALRYVQASSAIPCFLVYGAAGPEHLVNSVGARVLLHLEQTDLNFRETGIHGVLHVFLGSERHSGWADHRLRVYDRVLVPGEAEAERIGRMVRGLTGPATVCATGVDGSMDAAQVYGALIQAADDVVGLRRRRDERRRETANRIARELGSGGSE